MARRMVIVVVAAYLQLSPSVSQVDVVAQEGEKDTPKIVPTLMKAIVRQTESANDIVLVAPNGELALSQLGNGRLSLVDLKRNKKLAEFEEKSLRWYVRAFSPDSSKFAYWARDNRLVIRDGKTAKELREIDMPKEVSLARCCVFGSEGKFVAVVSGATLAVVDVATGRSRSFATGHLFGGYRISAGPHRGILVSCSPGANYRPVVLLDFHRRERIRDLQGLRVVDFLYPNGRRIPQNEHQSHANFIDVLFSPDGLRVLALAGRDSNGHSKICQWKTANGERTRIDQFKNLDLRRLGFLDWKGRWIIAVNEDQAQPGFSMVLLIDARTGRVVDQRDCAGPCKFLAVTTEKPQRRFFALQHPPTGPEIVTWTLKKVRPDDAEK